MASNNIGSYSAYHLWLGRVKDSTKSSRINRYASYGFLGTVEWALDLTNFVLTAAEADATSNITAAEDAFTAALSLSGYNTSNFETYNLTLLASKLVGWHGCDPLQKKEIYSGWQQSWEIMNYMMSEAYDDKINWNEAATVEYLGAPAMNQHLRERFKNIYVNLATIQPGWIGMPWDWRIVARCDDPHLACSCGRDTQTVAYTVNSDQDEPSAPAINFCPPYFGQPTLKTVLESANPGFTPAIYADMNNYNGNQATTWMHELLHIDWVALANGWGPNTHVTDIKMKYNYDTGPKWVTAYAPYLNKGLARVQTQFADWTIQNADSMALFALAKFIQNKLGDIYPHLPLAPPPPLDVKRYLVPGYFDYYANGTGEILNQTAMDDASWTASMGTCALGTDPDGAAGSAAIATVTSWPVQTDYPDDYLSSWSSWAGLATSTTTKATSTTTAAPTPTESWSIAIYSEKDCSGDYYVVSGYNEDTTQNTCLVINDLTTTSSDTDVSCGWYTDGGFSNTSCDKGTLTKPLSWRITGPNGAICTAYNTNTCDNNGYEDAYTTWDECHNYSSSNFDTEEWIALQCGL
ncbi:hypothetical protein CBS147326_6518 [Penicillium roqueforti]|nr:hypothetical protein CBS147326_6518 [Penicillium roqueforti]